ncbi:MAG TPA: CRISPR-associated protein Cas4 [Candidatus Angelobacter sp.]|jgi:CRISPR-associated exonuclease Cas4|nr:CRISPR-associated protein Cas4 [Candidatus Angelobacter sp.]
MQTAELIPLRVNDLKQYEYCPRIVFYNTVMPLDRKVTFKMQRGTEAEFQLDALEKRRSLRRYKLTEGERRFHVWLHSERFGLSGKMDLLIVSQQGYFPVDFKYTRGRPYRNHISQLAGYAVLVEEQYQTEVETGFIYLAPVGELVAIKITKELKKEVSERLASIREMVRDELLPPPTLVRARCAECEFRNYCGDIF